MIKLYDVVKIAADVELHLTIPKGDDIIIGSGEKVLITQMLGNPLAYVAKHGEFSFLVHPNEIEEIANDSSISV